MKEIQLTQGKVALVDDSDFERVNQFKWYAQRGWYGTTGITWYARRAFQRSLGRQGWIRLHQFILPGADGIDHKNGNGLDCRKQNLRSATDAQNQGNRKKQAGASSKYKGVCWHRAARKWAAGICSRGVSKHLGVFVEEKEAAMAYDTEAKKLFGEFARLNFGGAK